MSKLHELLAVESQLKGQAQATRTELKATFEKKRHLFEEKLLTYKPSAEGAEPIQEQQSSLQSTVDSELKWIAGIWRKAIDVSYAVAEGNTSARADVILDDGTVLLKGIPATGLLELEKRAQEIHDLINSVPTLDPAKGFTPDLDKGKNVFRARELRRKRTQKIQRPIVLFPATPEHPAQTQLISEDVEVGTLFEQEWSGLITPAQKADLLTRCEEIARAIKQARCRANEVVVATSQSIGGKLFDYVIEGKR